MEMWVEKYRPSRVEELEGQKDAVKVLSSFVKAKEIQNIILAGPPGCGKTTAALALAKEILGETWQDNLMELNASDQRGIDTIRINIKNFGKMRSLSEESYRIVFLDEADQLTQEAQTALRRIMEVYSEHLRFIFSCNYSSNIIEPIQSRAIVLRFKRLEKEDIVRALKKIGEKENLKISEDVYSAIGELSEGDLRKAINSLQSISYIEEPKVRDVYELEGIVEEKELRPLLANVRNGNFEEASKIAQDLLVERGYSGLEIVKGLHILMRYEQVPPVLKRESILALADAEYRIVQGGTEKIQIDYLIARLCSISVEKV